MLDDERNLLLMCKPELTLQSGLSNVHYDVAARCVDNGWLVFLWDEEEVIPGPPPAMKIDRAVYRITPAGSAALFSSYQSAGI